jgi:hypothetical protein
MHVYYAFIYILKIFARGDGTGGKNLSVESVEIQFMLSNTSGRSTEAFLLTR